MWCCTLTYGGPTSNKCFGAVALKLEACSLLNDDSATAVAITCATPAFARTSPSGPCDACYYWSGGSSINSAIRWNTNTRLDLKGLPFYISLRYSLHRRALCQPLLLWLLRLQPCCNPPPYELPGTRRPPSITRRRIYSRCKGHISATLNDSRTERSV